MIDFILYLFCAFTLLSFSISLVDGYPLFAVIWLPSIFIACASIPYPGFVRTVWAVFFLGMLLGKFLFSMFVQPILLVHTSSLTFGSFNRPDLLGYRAPKEIKKVVLSLTVFLSFIGPLLESSGLGSSSEFSSQLHSASKSPISYSLTGVSSALYSYWIWAIILLKSQFKTSAYKLFLDRYLAAPIIAQFIGSLKYLAFLSDYGLKLVSPATTYLSFRFFHLFMWPALVSQISRQKLNLLLVFSFIAACLSIAFGFFIYSALGLSFLDLLLLKVLGRADGYVYFNPDTLNNLIAVYGGNFSYFFQPFLKAIGFKAYDMPIGSWLVSGGNNLTQIGGPNVHLPVVIYILSYGGAIGIFSVFLTGLLCSLPLLYARNKIVRLINGSCPRPIYWSIFFFFNFILLLTEPSAFGHSLFFSSIIFMILKLFFPKLFHVDKPVSSRP